MLMGFGVIVLLWILAIFGPSPSSESVLRSPSDMFDNVLLNWRREGPEKRDVFLSRGWGAGGFGSEEFKMNPDQFRNPNLEYINVELEPNEPESRYVRFRSEEPNIIGAQTYPNASKLSHKQRHVPRLFVSYGWGPLGKK